MSKIVFLEADEIKIWDRFLNYKNIKMQTPLGYPMNGIYIRRVLKISILF